MFVIWGNRGDVHQISDSQVAQCPICKHGTYSFWLAYRWFHLYWLFGMITQRQYHAVCDRCQHSVEVDREIIPQEFLDDERLPFFRRWGLIGLGGSLACIVFAVVGLAGFSAATGGKRHVAARPIVREDRFFVPAENRSLPAQPQKIERRERGPEPSKGFKETFPLGGGYDGSMVRDAAPAGGLLTGLEIGLDAAGNSIDSIRAIFRTGQVESFGRQFGVATGNTITVKAKAGFAVGAIVLESSSTIEGLSLAFMRISDDHLNTQDSYESDWVGGHVDLNPILLTGKGRPVTGLIVRFDKRGQLGLGLMLTRPPTTPLASADRKPAPTPSDLPPASPTSIQPKSQTSAPALEPARPLSPTDTAAIAAKLEKLGIRRVTRDSKASATAPETSTLGFVGDVFHVSAPAGGLLVGLKLGPGKFLQNEIIASVQPIFRVGNQESLGRTFGRSIGGETVVKAKDGYAIGSLTVATSLGIDGLMATFMRIDGDKLDPRDSYDSDWIGGLGHKTATIISGDGRAVRGAALRLRSPNEECKGIGLVFDTAGLPPDPKPKAGTPFRSTGPQSRFPTMKRN